MAGIICWTYSERKASIQAIQLHNCFEAELIFPSIPLYSYLEKDSYHIHLPYILSIKLCIHKWSISGDSLKCNILPRKHNVELEKFHYCEIQYPLLRKLWYSILRSESAYCLCMTYGYSSIIVLVNSFIFGKCVIENNISTLRGYWICNISNGWKQSISSRWTHAFFPEKLMNSTEFDYNS